ncbi:hypothetical protein [uncultured Vibrio sp.]|uniref:hypothetical protein n=1 Tax=uncultured Vibrio sp. TaxID=114054 RepID=UPI00260120AB|nr:hypothetical protein [uncultured Vibrio sp.]
MSVRLIKLFWISFLALLLPSQAFAYLAKSDQALNAAQFEFATNGQYDVTLLAFEGALPSHESTVPSSNSLGSGTPSNTNNSNHHSPRPISQSELSDSAIAILNSNRWLSASSLLEEAKDVESELLDALTHLPHYKQANQPAYVSFEDAFASSHRISGWKETNALYVALNSQF